jgi:ATP-dependent protease ClpP protease subunit/regulator of replication initiation timing
MNYDLTLKGFVGGWNFDSDYIDYILAKKKDTCVNVLIDSLGGLTNTALSVSSAFRNHGNVNVTFRGMNASAATIASLGAKHIAMDEDALYLIHKCSVTVFEWASMNEEELAEHIKKLEHTRQNSMKVDVAVARAYAKRTGKSTDELLELMSKELWLTADEAKEYGFIDEVIKTEEKQKAEVVLTSSMEERFKEAGIPIPSMLKHEEESFFSRMMKFFTSQNNKTMESNQQQQNQQQSNAQQQQQAAQQSSAQPDLQTLQKQVSDMQTQLASLTETNKTLSKENEQLKSDIEALRKKPAEQPTTVINNGNGNGEQKEEENDFLSSLKEAQEISKIIG